MAYPLSQPYATWATLLTGLLLTGSLVLFLRNLQNELVRTQQLNDLKLRFFSMASNIHEPAYPPQHDFVIDGNRYRSTFPAFLTSRSKTTWNASHLHGPADEPTHH